MARRTRNCRRASPSCGPTWPAEDVWGEVRDHHVRRGALNPIGVSVALERSIAEDDLNSRH